MQNMGTDRAYSEKHRRHHQHHSDTEVIGSDRTTFGGPLSGPLNKRGSRNSARFNISGSSSKSNEQDYVEITLDVRDDDSVEVHRVKTAGGADVEDPELTFLVKGLEKNASSKIRQVSQELKRLASLNKIT